MTETTSQKAKFSFSCTRCGACCDNREPVPLVLEDIDRFATRKMMERLFPYIRVSQDAAGIMQLVLGTIPSKTGKDAGEDASNEKGKCPMYNADGKACLIWKDRPVYCRAFPLGHNGGSFVVEMDECPGLAHEGEMDKELLKQMRLDAKATFDGKRLAGITLPVLQAIIMKTLQEEQMKTMSKLSPEDLEKLRTVFEKVEKDDQA